MKVIWGLGKLLTLVFWLVVLVNQLTPFVYPLHLLVNLAGVPSGGASSTGGAVLLPQPQRPRPPWLDRLKILFSAFSTCKPSRLPPHLRLPMRKLCLLAALISPLACAQVVSVETNSLMRLPNTASTLQLERLEVADYGTLLIPSNVTEVSVGELRLGRDARITIVPGEQALELKVNRAELSEGSQITARGAPGTYQKAARSGRNLNLQIKALTAPQLLVDGRGGAGAPGFVGLDGANGQAPGCAWGQAGRGADGSDGSNGQAGCAWRGGQAGGAA